VLDTSCKASMYESEPVYTSKHDTMLISYKPGTTVYVRVHIRKRSFPKSKLNTKMLLDYRGPLEIGHIDACMHARTSSWTTLTLRRTAS